MSRYCLVGLVVLLAAPSQVFGEEAPFSGPQIGEAMPAFTVKGAFDGRAGKDFDFIQQSKGQPVALIFVHARTRPAFGLTNAVMRYAASRSKEGLECGVVFLTDDLTSTADWMQRVRQHLPEGVFYGVSADGVEGPGSYGLNRNVTLTVLVGKEGKVTANFALVQPSLNADGPKILKAIVDVSGGGKAPAIEELAGGRYAAASRKRAMANQRPLANRGTGDDPKLATLLRSVIRKDASKEDVGKAVTAVEKYVEQHKNVRSQLGRIATTIVNSGKIANYGTQAGQESLRKWAKDYGVASKEGQEKSPR